MKELVILVAALLVLPSMSFAKTYKTSTLTHVSIANKAVNHQFQIVELTPTGGSKAKEPKYALIFTDGKKKPKRVAINASAARAHSSSATKIIWDQEYRRKPSSNCLEYAKIKSPSTSTNICLSDTKNVARTRVLLSKLHELATK